MVKTVHGRIVVSEFALHQRYYVLCLMAYQPLQVIYAKAILLKEQ